ncbi:MAG: iron-sulfur cluster assembly accessory protein [Planctomycetota bacterium]
MTITLTEKAAKEVQRLVDLQRQDSGDSEQAETPLYLRVAVKEGGCSGLSYGLDLTDKKTDQDEASTQHGIELICDSKSVVHLDGTTVDFRDGLMGGGFVFSNPKAKSGCGCGTSFAV